LDSQPSSCTGENPDEARKGFDLLVVGTDKIFGLDIGRNQEATAVPASASRGNIQEKAANLYQNAERAAHTWKHRH
jgi:hypothetical protein